jgi:hypothetical protein
MTWEWRMTSELFGQQVLDAVIAIVTSGKMSQIAL